METIHTLLADRPSVARHRLLAVLIALAALLTVIVVIQLVSASVASASFAQVLWKRTWITQKPLPISNVKVAVNNTGTLFEVADYASGGHTHIVLRSFSPRGVVHWTRFFAPTGRDVSVAAIAIAPLGRLVIVGTTSGAKGSDWLLLDYRNNGSRAWSRTVDFSGQNGDAANGVAVSPLGRIFVTGVGVFAGGNSNAVTRAYSGAGALLWSRAYDGPLHGGDAGSAIALDAHGNVFVAGSTDTAAGETDVLLIRYGAGGTRKWLRTDGAANTASFANSLSVLGSTIGIAGVRFSGTDGLRFGDAVAIRYTTDGTLQWANIFGGSFTTSFVSVAVVPKTGGVVAAGYTGQSLFSLTTGIIVAYLANGQVSHLQKVGNADGSVASAIAVTPGRTYVATGSVAEVSGTLMCVLMAEVTANPGVNSTFTYDSNGAADGGQSIGLTSGAAYVGGVLNGRLAMVKVSLLS